MRGDRGGEDGKGDGNDHDGGAQKPRQHRPTVPAVVRNIVVWLATGRDPQEGLDPRPA
jgi:hypothetical protein